MIFVIPPLIRTKCLTCQSQKYVFKNKDQSIHNNTTLYNIKQNGMWKNETPKYTKRNKNQPFQKLQARIYTAKTTNNKN